MQAEIESIEHHLSIAIERCQINKIVCVNYEYERNNTTLEKANEFLNLQRDNKINADLLYFFNDLHNLKTNVVRGNENEEEAIEVQIQESIKKLEFKSLEIIKEKIYILELNNFFVKILEQEAGFDTITPNTKLTISSWALDRAKQTVGIDLTDNTAVDIICYDPGYTFVEKLQTVATKYRQEQNDGIVRKNYMR